MTKRNYWLDLFTGATWREFKEAGARVSGFRETRWATVQRIKAGDYLLCYLTGLSRFVGVLEVLDAPYKDKSRIWKDEEFPCRLKVKVVAELTPETAVPVLELRDNLSFFQNLTSPYAWTGRFRASPAKWDPADAEVVVQAVLDGRARERVSTVALGPSRDTPSTKTNRGLGSAWQVLSVHGCPFAARRDGDR